MASEHPGGPRNRLADEISPYLLQHQSNPVDWHPWGEEALSRARAEDKPIFLSVGYSTCYWCHVMERESFSDEATAELMNRFFINIKVDREERPDIDEIYMAATQLLTQQGGWPNSVFLTPDLKPFYAGTYFPPAPRHGLPAFSSVVQGLAEAWETRRSDVLMQAEELEGAMRRFLEERGEPQPTVPVAEVARRSLELLQHRFDSRHGGFGGAPKFPTPANLYLLDALADEDPRALEMLSITLDRMARGGIYDQLAGGFHRYATDEAWLVPHFEKMLYDNALLLELYGRHAARSGDGEAVRIASEIVTFLEREMSAPEGGFWSALDAESEGHEGVYHVWSREQLDAELGEENSAFLAPIFGFDDAPFFEGEYYVLHLPEPLAVQAERRRMGLDELLAELEPFKERLLAARQKRQPPRLDDKVLTDWNGMTISGLAVAGHLLGDLDWIERAARAADFILAELRLGDGGLAHSWRLGQARIPAFLGDYVFLIRGLLALYEATAEDRWLREAERLSEEQEARLADPRGGFCSVGEQEDVLFRSKEVFDGALPATNGVAILNLLELWRHSDEPRWLEAAERALKAFAMLISERPDGARMLALATRRYHDLCGQTAPASAEDAEDTGVVQATLSVEDAGGDGWRPFRVEVAVRDGWHVYAADVTAPLFATRLVACGGELRALTFPGSEKKDLAGDGELVAIYEGSFTISGEVRETAPDKARLVLQAQPCTAARCLAPLDIAL